MMQWEDRGFILKHRRHGEHDAILTILTEGHGKHLGLVKAGFSRRRRALIEPGQEVTLRWQARLSDQLGRFDLEPMRNLCAINIDDQGQLSAFLSAAALLEQALPEREPHADLFCNLETLLEGLASTSWPLSYVRWEAALLSGLGYGFDLTKCAATGKTGNLAYVSPRSGRAVSIEGAGPYRQRLLPLPSFLCDTRTSANLEDIQAGLALTGHFFINHVFHHRAVPMERQRLIDVLNRKKDMP